MATEFTLTIHDAIQDERFQIAAQGALTIGELLKTIVEERGLPKTNFLSESVEYELIHLRTGDVLSPPSTIAEIAPRSDDILELRSNEGSLVHDLIDELLDEIKENIIEDAIDKAWKKLKRIDRTGARSKKIEAARYKIQETAAHAPGFGGGQPASASERPELYSAQQKVSPKPQRKGPGCLLIGLFIGGLVVVAGFGLLLLIILPPLLSGPAAPEFTEPFYEEPGEYQEVPMEPTEFIPPEQPAEPTEFVPEVCTDDYGAVETAYLDFQKNEAVFVYVNEGACVWEPGVVELVHVDGDMIQRSARLPRPVPPGDAIEIRMPIPPEYYEDRRTSVYMLSGRDGPFPDEAVIEFSPID